MEGYNSGPRPLPWSLKQPLVEQVIVEDDGDFPPSSFVWPEDPNERVVIPFYLSLNEYNILGSTIDVGSDIAFAEDALRVVWLWMRNFRIEVPSGGSQMNCCGPSLTDRLNSTTYINDYYAQYATTLNQYITDGNTLDTIAPNMVPAMSSQGNIDQLMCVGWRIILASIIEDINALKAMSAEQQRDLIAALSAALGGLAAAGGVGLSIGGVAATTVAFFGGPWLVLGLGLATVGLAIATVIASISSSQLNDKQAFEDLLCHIYENTQGSAPSYSWFSSAINLADLPNDTAVYALGNVVAPYLQDLNVFLQFMVNMSQYYDVVDWGIIPETCACDTGATIQLQASPGWPASSVQYDGVDGTDDVYIITTIATEHYAVMGVMEKDADEFLIMDIVADPVSLTGYLGIGNGSFLVADVPDNVPITGFGVYQFPAGTELTIKVRPA